MSRNDPTEILVAVHLDMPEKNAVLVSINGEGRRAEWVPRSMISSFKLTGESTEGTSDRGDRVKCPLANMIVPEWFAKDRGFI